MKKYIFLFFALVCFVALQAQTADVAITGTTDTVTVAVETVNYSADAGTPAQDIEKTVVEQIRIAAKQIIGYIDWVLMLTFLAVSWLTLPASEATNHFAWFYWWAKIPKLLQSLIIGIITCCIFWFLFDYSGKAGMISAFFTLILDMILYKMGIDKAIKWIFTKFGYKFDKPEENKINNNPPTQT